MVEEQVFNQLVHELPEIGCKVGLLDDLAECKLRGYAIGFYTYSPEPRLSVGQHESPVMRLIMLLHEIGHFIDDACEPYAYAMPTKEQGILWEENAWINAEAIARHFGLWTPAFEKLFLDEYVTCLNTYLL